MSKEQQQGGSAHPLFQMTFESEEKNFNPASQENADEIDETVESILADQGNGEITSAGDPPANPPAEQADTTTTTNDADVDGFSQSALVALSYQKTHQKIGADVEIPKDLTPDGLIDMLVAAKAGQERERDETWEKERMASVIAQLEEKGVSKKDFELLAHLKRGGSGQVVSRYHELKEWATDKVETEEEMLETIKFAAELAGQKAEYVDAYIASNLVDPAEIKKAFDEAQKSIDAVAEKELEADQERVRQGEQAKKDQWSSFENSVKATVAKPVKGITLTKADQEDVIDFMTKKSVVKDIVVNGRKVRKEITPYQEFGMNLQKNIEENVLFAYYAMKGSVGMVNAANQAANDKFLAAASAQASNKTTGSKTVAQQAIDDAEGEVLTTIGFQ